MITCLTETIVVPYSMALLLSLGTPGSPSTVHYQTTCDSNYSPRTVQIHNRRYLPFSRYPNGYVSTYR